MPDGLVKPSGTKKDDYILSKLVKKLAPFTKPADWPNSELKNFHLCILYANFGNT
jgi:hypothetical protein